MSRYYRLAGKVPVRCTLDEWMKWQGDKKKSVAVDQIGGALISTIFLGLDHRIMRRDPPLLFETLVFGGPADGRTDQCATYDEAVAMHQAMRDQVQAMMDQAGAAIDRARRRAFRDS